MILVVVLFLECFWEEFLYCFFCNAVSILEGQKRQSLFSDERSEGENKAYCCAFNFNTLQHKRYTWVVYDLRQLKQRIIPIITIFSQTMLSINLFNPDIAFWWFAEYSSVKMSVSGSKKKRMCAKNLPGEKSHLFTQQFTLLWNQGFIQSS